MAVEATKRIAFIRPIQREKEHQGKQDKNRKDKGNQNKKIKKINTKA
ncbi:MAG: hypothetical protein KatS3mg078_0125 [Deltaproteobacteria bacterium]|jgi:hypothetical protein|nr:MAG: hypothetical protein KatS3mg078_0125 [Deltaproteobacteria bacterium]